MINSNKARTPILALILFVFAVGNAVADNKVVVIPLGADSGPQSVAAYSDGGGRVRVGTTRQSLGKVSITAPTDGIVIVNSTVSVLEGTAADGAECSITTSPSKFSTPDLDSAYIQWWISGGIGGAIRATLAGTRGFSVSAGQLSYYRLVCKHTGTDNTTTSFDDASITAIFIPSS